MSEKKPTKQRKSKNLNKDSNTKLELAQNIAKNSKKVTKAYASAENSIIYSFRWLSGIIDKFLFSKRLGKYAALLVAILLYFGVNATSSTGVFLSTTSGVQINNIPVQVIVNSEVYEIEGVPTTVSATVLGNASDIQLLKAENNYKVTADLSGLQEGQHQVTLTTVDFSNNLTVTLNPSTVIVTVKRKTTEKFKISHEYINTNMMDSMYSLSDTPTFDTTEVLIRASQDTLDRVAYVKALIDTTGVTQDFNTEARLVAYDQNGTMMNVDIIPSTVAVSVKVTTPMKEVPITVIPVGELPNNNAIQSITLDHAKVTVYAPDSVLAELDQIEVQIDATNIDKDSSWTYALKLPSGVNKLSVTKVNISVKIEEAVTKTFDTVVVRFKNNINGYRLNLATTDEYMSVTVKGTQKNIDSITADDISVYLDMADVTVGSNKEIPIVVSGTNALLSYSMTDGRESLNATVVKP